MSQRSQKERDNLLVYDEQLLDGAQNLNCLEKEITKCELEIKHQYLRLVKLGAS